MPLRQDPRTGQAQDVLLGYHVQLLLRPQFRDLIPSDRDYLSVFHFFEYILGLVVVDLTNERAYWPAWFARSGQIGESPSAVLDSQIEKQGDELPLLKAGFFGGSRGRLIQIKAKLDEKLGA